LQFTPRWCVLQFHQQHDHFEQRSRQRFNDFELDDDGSTSQHSIHSMARAAVGDLANRSRNGFLKLGSGEKAASKLAVEPFHARGVLCVDSAAAGLQQQ